jgi:hypothetical protein
MQLASNLEVIKAGIRASKNLYDVIGQAIGELD